MKRNHIQILALILTLTLAACLMRLLGVAERPTAIVEYAATVVLFLLALWIPARKGVSMAVKGAFAFSLAGDFFLALLPALAPDFDGNLIGMGLFLAAYLFLIAAFGKNVRIKREELLTGIGLLLILGAFLIQVLPYAQGVFFGALLAFSAVITVMAWSGVSTLFRGWYGKRASRLIAAGALSIVASDILVALVLFHPAFQNPSVWTEVLIRITYTPAWGMFLLAFLEEAE